MSFYLFKIEYYSHYNSFLVWNSLLKKITAEKFIERFYLNQNTRYVFFLAWILVFVFSFFWFELKITTSTFLFDKGHKFRKGDRSHPTNHPSTAMDSLDNKNIFKSLKPLSIFWKSFILDVWLFSEYVSVHNSLDNKDNGN